VGLRREKREGGHRWEERIIYVVLRLFVNGGGVGNRDYRCASCATNAV